MLPGHGIRFVVAVAISFVFGAFARCEQPTPDTPQPTPPAKQVRTDLSGNTLPPGAIARMGTVTRVNSVVFSPDGKTLASASDDKTVRLWEAASGKEIRQFQGHGNTVRSVVFSPDGKTLASASFDKTVRLWDVASGKEIRQFQGHQGGVSSVAFSPDGNTLASASADKTVRLWEAASGKEIRKFQGHQAGVFSVVFSPDGKTLASVSDDNTVRLWEAATGKEIRQLYVQQWHRCICNVSVVLSPDGKTLASADSTVRLWELASGKEIRQFQGHQGWVTSVVFSPDGKTLASAGRDTTVRLWELASGKEIKKLEGYQGVVHSLVFSPDGRTLASVGANSTVLVWRLSEICCGTDLTTKLDPKHLQDLWADLANEDAAKAYQAIYTLIVGGKETVTFFQQQLPPVPVSVHAQRIARLLADLDDNEYAVREKASDELARLGDLALPALQKTLAAEPAPEVLYRVEILLAKLPTSTPTPERLRMQRAVMVLEQIASPEAKDLLETLAKGAEGAWLTEEAKAARQRMKP